MNARKTQWLVFFAALALAAWPALAPAPESDFDLERFARLPILEGGRVKPLDSFARNSLLSIQGRQSFSSEGRRAPAAQWLLDAAFKPSAADAYPVFVIDDPELLGLLGLERRRERRFAYWQFDAKREEVQKQAAAAEQQPSGARTRFQSAVINFERCLTLYERIKNTFMVTGPTDPVKELEAFTALIPSALRAVHAAKHTQTDRLAMKALAEMLERYHFLAQAAAFKALPPRSGEAAEAWTNTGEALSRPRSGVVPHPGLESFALMGRAYRGGDAAAFNSALAKHAGWIAANRPKEARMAAAEALFNKCRPFISGMVLYLLALLAVFSAWATGKSEHAAGARALAWAAFTVHTLGLLARTLLQGRPPVTNLYSSAVFVGWAAALLGLAAERVHRRGFAALAACAIGFSTLIIAHHLSASGDTMEMMRAVLDSNFWLATHVVAITIGYSATYLAGLLGIVWVARRHLGRSLDPAASKALASLAYGTVAFSLFFSFIGTVLGGIWADQSWGRFWGWDPKENGALLIVLWHALILHARWGGFVRERGFMLMTIFGNIIVSLSWFGVNMLGIGLHSYGFMDKAFWWLSAFSLSQLALMTLGALPPRFWQPREP